MSLMQCSKLYRRLIKSPAYVRRAPGVYVHEQWLEVILRRFGVYFG